MSTSRTDPNAPRTSGLPSSSGTPARETMPHASPATSNHVAGRSWGGRARITDRVSGVSPKARAASTTTAIR